ncbi:hypothetical protein ACFQPF_00970 [Fictibacillus iocasae]|uniref:Methanol dehydrogenase n=1 Tax=Fictibacillus iocasae TaxID=2715437 RepID=A0ABW2NM93_9BACL
MEQIFIFFTFFIAIIFAAALKSSYKGNGNVKRHSARNSPFFFSNDQTDYDHSYNHHDCHNGGGFFDGGSSGGGDCAGGGN